MAKSKKGTKKQAIKFITITNNKYGKDLQGIKIYYEGNRPKSLQDDGMIGFGKHILQALKKQFKKFQWIITEQTNAITTENGVKKVRTSQKLIRKMSQENWDRSRDIKHDIVRRLFSSTFPDHFTKIAVSTYVPGTLADIVSAEMVHRLSSQDKEALNSFLPEYVAGEAVGVVQKLQATAQIDTLKSLCANLAAELDRNHPESWWQSYVKSNILLMQQGYIKAIEKMNIAFGDTKYPDFCLITHDNYLDILEIKKPNTDLLKHDTDRDNFYWHTEMAKAISQTENYIQQVSSKASEVRSYLLDTEDINIKAVRPRGIILVGDSRTFIGQKQKDDFRLLSHGIKNISILTYDELLNRMNNYIGVLEKFTSPLKKKATGKKKK